MTPIELNGWMNHFRRVPSDSVLLLFIAALLASYFWEKATSMADVAAYLSGEPIHEDKVSAQIMTPVDATDPAVQERIRAVAAEYRSRKEKG